MVLCIIAYNQFFLCGQTFTNFKKIGKVDGLSQYSVFSIAEDKDGFLWFGSRDGLNKYDGYNFKVYRNDVNQKSVTASDVRVLYNDPLTKKLWIGTLNGLSLYNSKTDDFENFIHIPSDESTISSKDIRCIFRSSDNKLLVATSIGLSIFNEKTRTFRRLYLGQNEKANKVEAILEVGKNEFWIGTNDGIYFLSKELKFSKLLDLYPFTNLNISTLNFDADGNIWIGTNADGVFYHKRKTGETTAFSISSNNKRLPNNQIRSLLVDHKNRVWIGTFKGIARYDIKDDRLEYFQASYSDDLSLSDNAIRSIFQDSRKAIWVGTYFGGINRIDEDHTQFENHSFNQHINSISNNVVSSFAEDKLGNCWIGTEGGGLDYFNVTNRRFENFNKFVGITDRLNGLNVKSLHYENDNLWIGTLNGGLIHYNVSTKNVERYQTSSTKPHLKISNNNVYSTLRLGDYLWISTFGGGLNIVNIKTKRITTYLPNEKVSNAISSEYCRVIVKSKNGEIYVGTSSGLNKVIMDANQMPVGFKKILKNVKIISLHEDKNGNLWVGTENDGLKLVNMNSFTSVNKIFDQAIVGRTIYGILEDRMNNLWLSSNSGISRLSLKNYSVISFDKSNGLLNTEYNFHAYFKMKNNTFLFGGINGFTTFDPSKIKLNEHIPNLVFTNLIQNNKEVSINQENKIIDANVNEAKEIVFSYNKANFTINFAALDFYNPIKNKYAFKLEGIDKDWNYTVGNPSATYTIQRAGKYIFKFRGANNNDLWNNNERNIMIKVLPPYWRTWWAYTIYLALFLVGLKFLLRFLKLKNSYKLEQISKKQQDELHQLKLKFFTNVAHEFRSPLTLILGPIQELLKNSLNRNTIEFNRLTTINNNAQRMLNLVNQLMTFQKMEEGHDPLQVRKVAINDFLENIANLFEDSMMMKGISFKTILDQGNEEVWIDELKMEKVISNLLYNAFKFTSVGGFIKLHKYADESNLYIKVEDSGVGIQSDRHQQIFQRFYQKNTSKSPNLIKGSGIGLALSKELVKLHGGDITVNSTPGEGSSFIVTLPIGQSHLNEADFDKSTLKNELGKTDDLDFHLDLEEIESISTYSETILSVPNKKILIIDDNKEIRDYTCSIFLDDYYVLTAEDGVEGYKKILEFSPDIIISDLMMPNRDGLELCKMTKSNIETSHIPFILLTAKDVIESKIEGLKLGALDYITKPFHPEELRLKVNHILSPKLDAQGDTYLEDKLNGKAKSIEITSIDEDFIEKLYELTEIHMGDPNFKLDILCTKLGISRSLLFTKVKILTNLTPKTYIKNYRLTRAKQMLESRKLTISEIAYQVGYSDPKYFTKVFKEEFSITPSEFLDTKKL
jgi:signal transduction histidine kinase/ligand-binding sensor domain-containing protein/DNA-binding response OmpR family regulator